MSLAPYIICLLEEFRILIRMEELSFLPAYKEHLRMRKKSHIAENFIA